MGDKIIFHLKNILKLIGIIYIFLVIKNILQIFFGLFTTFTDIEMYTIYNIHDSAYSLAIIIFYDFFAFVVMIYIWIFLFLYLLILEYKNKIWIQILYSVAIYLLAIFIFNRGEINDWFIIISVILGISNWWMFEKWIINNDNL